MAINDFTQYTLANAEIDNPTSLEFGPDGRLYVAQQNGLIKIFTVQEASGGGFEATAAETIALVRDMPNHDDDGAYNPNETTRQVTGLLATQDEAGAPVIYVTSSDPRMSNGSDLGLDTNSGVLSRLTLTADGTWEKVDLVRGLPRSEENHAVNGLELSPDGSKLYLAAGGHTNKGAPSNEFALAPEYYYSAAVLEVDLAALAALEASEGLKTYNPAPGTLDDQLYLYDLPTLDDPTRPNANGVDDPDAAGYDGEDVNDVFGGNDGLNQAKFDMTDRDGDGAPDPIVKVYSPGLRNAYDVLITQDGRLYTWDNGPNNNWGGEPTYADGTATVDLDGDGLPDFYDGDGDGVADIPGNHASAVEADKRPDALHLLDGDIGDGVNPSYYGGHPNLIRAYGAQAGLFDEHGAPLPAPVDLDSVNGYGADGAPIIDPRQSVYRTPEVKGNPDLNNNDQFNGALYTIASSSNGLAEYTATADPSLTGSILVVSFNGDITALPRNADGSIDAGSVSAKAVTNKPLDVVAQGDADPFAGTVWIAGYGPNQIIVLDPEEGLGVTPDPTDRDQDGVDDTIDPFAADPDNGAASILNAGEIWLFDFIEGAPLPNDTGNFFDGTAGLYNGFDIGFTGVMTDGQALPEAFYVDEEVIAGGAPNILQIKNLNVSGGTTEGDDQLYGFQFGMLPSAETGSFTYSATMDNFFDELAVIDPSRDVEQGLFIGTGDQSDYVKLAFARVDGLAGLAVTTEISSILGPGAPQSVFYAAPELAAASGADTVTLSLTVDVDAGTLTPGWTFTTGDGATVHTEADAATPVQSVTLSAGDPDQFTGPDPLLSAIRGERTLPSGAGQTPVGVALGVVASLEPTTLPDQADFPVDWAALSVEGFADPDAPDEVAPTVAIQVFDPGDAADAPFEVVVAYADDVALDPGTIQAADLVAVAPDDPSNGPVTMLVDDYQLTVSQDGKSASARYFLSSSTGSWGQGTYSFSVAAGAIADASGNAAAAESVLVDYPPVVAPPGSVIAAINAGGEAMTIGGIDWAADSRGAPHPALGLTGSNRTNDKATRDIEGAGEELRLYQAHRWSDADFGYDIDVVAGGGVAGGVYRVTIKFAETYGKVFVEGGRVFDVMVEGQHAEAGGVVVGDDLDIFARAGGNTAYDMVLEVDLADGDAILDLDFVHQGVQNPEIAAILVEAWDENFV